MGNAEPSKAVIFGCSGPALTDDERRFFEESLPAGFILFERNCQDPDQVRGLVGELRETVNRPDAPVLIDQEGGRVQRLKPPHWRDAPPPGAFAALAGRSLSRAEEAVCLNGQLIAAELSGLGITVNCAPVLDIPGPDAHAIIGDRAFGTDPDTIGAIATAALKGLEDGGVAGVIKHIPGHGRAMADSHMELPRVTAGEDELSSDFAAFHHVRHAPMAMTAHILLSAMDPVFPVTLSATVVSRVIRELIGFDGLLVTDDIGMFALTGTLGYRARKALDAGCDLVLHCSGILSEMEEVAMAVGPMSAASRDRAAYSETLYTKTRSKIDLAAARRELNELLA